jgi:acetyltransferase-like isoleucine patch superfamily enzyme
MKPADNIFFDLNTLAHLGRGAIVGRTVRIRKPEKCSIGAHSIVDDFAYISCAVTIGRYTHVGAQAVMIGGPAHIRIGDFVNLAPGARLLAASNNFTEGGLVGPAIPPEFADLSLVADIAIADHVLLGAGTVVLPGVQIPEGVSTGAMTLLTPHLKLEPWTVYVGTPARPLRPRDGTRMLEAARRLLATTETPPELPP